VAWTSSRERWALIGRRLQASARACADVVWFDSFVTNVDRDVRNTNMLVWHGRLWLIDHGSALYIHHTWKDVAAHARKPMAAIRVTS